MDAGSGPHPSGDVLFLRPDGIGVDRRGRELGVAEPLLHQAERDPGGDRGDAEPMPQPFR